MSVAPGSEKAVSESADGRRLSQQEAPSDAAASGNAGTQSKANHIVKARPRPISTLDITSAPLRSAPLSRNRAAERSPPPSRRSHSASGSPTRLSAPGDQEQRRSSDTGSQRPRVKELARHHEAPSKPLSRTSSLKRAALSRKHISSIASLMQGQNLEALLRGKRKSRKGSASGGSSKARSSSLPASPTRSRSESPTKGEQNSTEVQFSDPAWSPGNSSQLLQGSEDAKSTPVPSRKKAAVPLVTSDKEALKQSQPRRISFGTLPSRQLDATKHASRKTEPETSASVQGEGRRVSFAAPPKKTTVPEPPTQERESEEYEDEEEDEEELEGEEAAEDGDEEDATRLQQNSRPEREETIRTASPSPRRVKAIPRPMVTVTTPTGEKLPPKKIEVHPNTNYSAGLSIDEDNSSSESEEDMSDIRRAQRLAINLSTVDNTIEHRSIRTIIRGDFSTLQHEAEQGHRRLRTYLVATDLSGEAAYALEWTIGTVLRDGDTLVAVFAVDEEMGTGMVSEVDSPGLPVGEGGHAIQETQATMGKLAETAKPTSKTQVSFRRKGSAVPITRDPTKAEQERIHAVEDISQTCIKFLRKTKLQVRLGVEVVHCESPKHMITEAVSL